MKNYLLQLANQRTPEVNYVKNKMQEVAEKVLKKAHGTELFVLSWQHKLFPIDFSGRFISSDKHKTLQLRVQSRESTLEFLRCS